jgi:hypothetical protein
MRGSFAATAVGLLMTFGAPSPSRGGDDAGAGVPRARVALRFTEWTTIHTMGNVKGTDPAVVLQVEGRPEQQMMLMSCVDRPYGSYTHICAMFPRCAEVPKESWSAMIGEAPAGTLLVAACAYPLHAYVVRQDGDRVVVLRRKMRRAKREGVDAGAPDGGVTTLGDPFCSTCAAVPAEDWQESRAASVSSGTIVTTGPAVRRQARWDLD